MGSLETQSNDCIVVTAIFSTKCTSVGVQASVDTWVDINCDEDWPQTSCTSTKTGTKVQGNVLLLSQVQGNYSSALQIHT